MLGIGKEGHKILMEIRTGSIIWEAQCKIQIHASLFENDEVIWGGHSRALNWAQNPSKCQALGDCRGGMFMQPVLMGISFEDWDYGVNSVHI